ncbi:hypothetical protein BE18_33030 [Sorangium cellulosum]|uniref:Uncharacterized protein n=1 Tax=Sorangium cellulosum TaxID=56 RepID=A0A150S130_SORCE|nr:hypothetical protein BE18_33030 [Sorangium cellulosum]
MNLWQPAQPGSATCWAKRSRVEVTSSTGGGTLLTFAGGGLSGWHMRFSRTTMPRWMGEVWLW